MSQICKNKIASAMLTSSEFIEFFKDIRDCGFCWLIDMEISFNKNKSVNVVLLGENELARNKLISSFKEGLLGKLGWTEIFKEHK